MAGGNSQDQNMLYEILGKVNEVREGQIRMTLEIEQIKATSEERNKKVTDIHEAIYHPDSGIYRRINSAADKVDQHEKQLKALELKFSNKHTEIEQRIRPIENINKTLVDVGGERLEKVDQVVKKHDAITKLWVALALSIAGGVGKIIYDVIMSLYQHN